MLKIAAILAICAAPVAAQDVVAFNGYSVMLEGRPDKGSAGLPVPTEAVSGEATRICGTLQKSAEFASASMTDAVYARFLFLCL